MTGDQVAFFTVFFEFGIYLLADVHNVGTARVEPAGGWRMEEVGGRSWDGLESYSFSFDARKCFDQSLRVGMLGIPED